MSVIRVRVLANFTGSALTLVATFVPWISYSIGGTYSVVQVQSAWFSSAFVVFGGIISLLSRYGGLLTMAGVWRFVASPPIPFLFVASNVTITPFLDMGVWLAWAGATISLLGSSWALPIGMPRQEAYRKTLGTIFFPLSVVAIVFGSVLPEPESVILILSGSIVLAVCIILLLPGRGERFIQVLKDLGT